MNKKTKIKDETSVKNKNEKNNQLKTVKKPKQKEEKSEKEIKKEDKEEQQQTEIEEAKNQNEDGEQGEQNNEGENQNQNQNNNNNTGSETFKNGLIEGLKINVYLQKNNQITQISNNSWEDIQNEKDPHKRNIINKEKKILEKQEMFKSGINNNNSVIENKKFNRSRPASAYSNRKNYSIYKNSRPSSSKNRISSNTDNEDEEERTVV